MERTISYQGRRFAIRVDQVDEGYTESVTELSDGIGWQADWDGSGIVYPTASTCLDATEALVREQVETDAAAEAIGDDQ